MTKLLVLIIPNGDIIGGAQKRYLNVIRYLLENSQEYIVVLNNCLFKNSLEAGLIKDHERLITINLTERCLKTKSRNIDKKEKTYTNNTKNQFRLFLGKNKYRLRLLFEWFRFSIQIIPILYKFNIKTIYSIWYGGIWIWPLKFIKNFKLIYSYNDSGFSSLNRNWSNWLFSEYFVIKRANKIDFLSNGIYEGIKTERINIPDHKKLISPNSFINYTKFIPSKKKDNKIVFLGRISKIKNPILLAESVQLIDAFLRDKKFHVDYYGHGPEKLVLEEFVAKEKIQSIRLYDSTNKPWEVLSKSKIFISIQEFENYPSQAIMEAMACGNAIIASDVGETNKLVTYKEGTLVPLIASEIATAIKYFVDHPIETQKRGLAARKKTLKEQNIEKYMTYFKNITK